MNSVEMEFRHKGIIRGGLLLLEAAQAIEMVRRSHRLGIRILGVDGFDVTATTTQPLREHSIDISEGQDHLPQGANSWSVAEAFLLERAGMGLLFEVVTE